ncbi:MAG: sulfotransferase [Myxococcota bacterium]
MGSSRPLFVLGNHRSGTTWLANQLCRHPEIAGVQHERHHGIHESAWFSSLDGRYGDLRTRSNFIELVEVLAESDYCRIAEIDRAFLYAEWPIDYDQLFRRIMEEVARRAGARYWIEKTPAHTEFVDEIARRYPDARFVSVKRALESVVGSSLGMERHSSLTGATSRLKHIFSVALRWSYFNRLVDGYAQGSDRIVCLTYAEMRSDLEATMRRISDHLELPFDSRLLGSDFAANTSFSGDRTRDDALSGWERRLLSLLEGLFAATPISILRAVVSRARRREGRAPLPPWFFRLHPHASEQRDAAQSGSDP